MRIGWVLAPEPVRERLELAKGAADLCSSPFTQLVAAEYLVVQQQWLSTHDGPPALFGHTFDFTPAGNRFGLPAFYSLHAWAWEHNPAGPFTMWNPDVHCPAVHAWTK